MASAPTYDPRSMAGRDRSKHMSVLMRDERRPLLNRAIGGLYPPGSTFKISQALLGLQEGSINPSVALPLPSWLQLQRAPPRMSRTRLAHQPCSCHRHEL